MHSCRMTRISSVTLNLWREEALNLNFTHFTKLELGGLGTRSAWETHVSAVYMSDIATSGTLSGLVTVPAASDASVGGASDE